MIQGCYYHKMQGEELKNFSKISKSFINRWQRTNLKLATRPSAPKQVIGRFNLERLVICSHLSLQLRHAIIILKRFRYFLLPVIKKTRCSVVPLRMRSIRDMIGTSWLWILILWDVFTYKWGECWLRPCLHGGGGPQVGEVTCLTVVEK